MDLLSILNSLILAIVIIVEVRRKLKKIRLEKSKPINLLDVIKIDKYTQIGDNVIVTNSKTTIGKFCSIAKGVALGPSQHPIDFLSTHGFQYEKHSAGFVNENNIYNVSHLSKPCTIGNDVWIGRNAIIKDGITIGHGAVVGCGAVVTKDVPAYSVVVGIPAKIIKYRFDEETIKELLELKWWDYPENILVTLPFNDVKKCIQILKIYRNVK